MTADQRYHQGAKVSRPYFMLQTKASAAVTITGTEVIRSEAYKLAKSKPHKSWAKRWMKQKEYI